eukprot:3762162-Rhodomonas_salina.1
MQTPCSASPVHASPCVPHTKEATTEKTSPEWRGMRLPLSMKRAVPRRSHVPLWEWSWRKKVCEEPGPCDASEWTVRCREETRVSSNRREFPLCRPNVNVRPAHSSVLSASAPRCVSIARTSSSSSSTSSSVICPGKPAASSVSSLCENPRFRGAKGEEKVQVAIRGVGARRPQTDKPAEATVEGDADAGRMAQSLSSESS